MHLVEKWWIFCFLPILSELSSLIHWSSNLFSYFLCVTSIFTLVDKVYLYNLLRTVVIFIEPKWSTAFLHSVNYEFLFNFNADNKMQNDCSLSKIKPLMKLCDLLEMKLFSILCSDAWTFLIFILQLTPKSPTYITSYRFTFS